MRPISFCPNMNLRRFQSNFESPPECKCCQNYGQMPYMHYANNVTKMPTDQQNQQSLQTNNIYSAVQNSPLEPQIFRPWESRKAEKSSPTTVASNINLGNNVNMSVDLNHRHKVIDPPKKRTVGFSTPNTKPLDMDITNNNKKTPTDDASNSNSLNININTPVDWSVRAVNFITATSSPSKIINPEEGKSSDKLLHSNNNYIVAEEENSNDSRNIEEASRFTTYPHKIVRKSKRSYSTAEKLNAIHRVKVKYGEKASKVCKDLGISQVNFCRWLQNSELMMLYEKQKNGFQPNYSNDSFNVTDITNSNNNFNTLGKENDSTNTAEASRLPAKQILHRKFSTTAKLYAIHRVKNGETQSSLCRRIGVEASILCRWLQNADLLKLYEGNKDPAITTMTTQDLLRYETIVINPGDCKK